MQSRNSSVPLLNTVLGKEVVLRKVSWLSFSLHGLNVSMVDQMRMFLHPRFRKLKKNKGAKKQVVEDAWKCSREREAVLANMSKSERKRRRYE